MHWLALEESSFILQPLFQHYSKKIFYFFLLFVFMYCICVELFLGVGVEPAAWQSSFALATDRWPFKRLTLPSTLVNGVNGSSY